MQRTLVVLLVAVSAMLSACGSTPEVPTTDQATAPSEVEPSTAGADSGAAAEGSMIDDESAGPLEGMLARRVVFFDFDSSEIRGEGTEIVGAHARHLAGNPNLKVRLEGHTDERGSREYNIGLGERRAQAVRRALMLQGAGEAQLSTVSYGEERPSAAGSDESAWSQNRRVEIIYLK